MLSSPSLPAAHGLGPRQIPLRPLVGYLAIAVTVLVWAGFALSTRAASGAQLTFGDVALIRSGIPALFFLPFLPKRIAVLRQLPARRWLMIAAGAGLP